MAFPSKAYCCLEDGGGGSPSDGLPDNNIIETAIAYLALIADDIILATGTFTIDLPPVASATKPLIVKSILGGGTVTIDADGAETIEGAATQGLTAGTAITISPSTGGWLIV